MALYYKNPRMKKSDNGKYILNFDKCVMNNDPYEGMSYMGEGEESFDDGTEAIKRLDQMHELQKKGEMLMMEAKAKKKSEEEDAD